MNKRILVILGHQSKTSFCAAIADSYIKGAVAAGNEVRFIDLGSISFDPLLKNGYEEAQELEPDLLKAQEEIKWAEHIVFIYPNWWGTMPAILKGFIDRTFLPGFAFKYRKDSVFWDKLLVGRSAHVIVTMDTPAWYYRFIYNRPGHNQIKYTILGFCGIKPITITSFAPIKGSSQKQREQWLEQANKYGEKA